MSAITCTTARQYDLFQRSLESLDKERKYLNYGYTLSRKAGYEERQEQLCLEVFRAADVSRGDVVVDVGFGSGEQDFLLQRTHGFSKLHGFNIAEKQVRYANDRARREGLEERMVFHHGQAECLDGMANAAVDKVLAIECAFYFDRPRFYRRAAEVLKPGGLLVMADMMFADRMAFLTRRSEEHRRMGTKSANREAWEEHFRTRSMRRINRFTRPGAQKTVYQILRILPTSGISGAEVREWLRMAFATQLAVGCLLTHLIHYDLIVLEKHPGA